MPRPVEDMLEDLRAHSKRLARVGASARALELARRVPLVHRTGKPGCPWRSIFESRKLAANEPGTRWERDHMGVKAATYFFWGCGAYPKGTVALLLTAPLNADSRATLFDTGGCETGYFTRYGAKFEGTTSWATLEEFSVNDGARVHEVGAEYVAGLFDDLLDYVRAPQTSVPDHRPLHGLESPTRNRLAWSVEVAVYSDVPVPPERLSSVIVSGRDQYRELPDSYRRKAIFADSDTITLAEAIADRIARSVGESS